MPSDQADRVLGQPSKEFFVEMITRDLTMTDAILDLVDNSVDQAVEDSGADVTRLLLGGKPKKLKATVRLTVESQSFVISDDCGGIGLDDARRRVFRFGEPDAAATTGGLSVYGIGMKRAFFKLGRKITVESRTRRSYFRIDIDVAVWLAQGDENWDFAFAETRSGPQARTGTTITISELRPEVKRRLQQDIFRAELRRRLQTTYSLFLGDGLHLILNGHPLQARLPMIVKDESLQPSWRSFKELGVRVFVSVGVSPPHDKEGYGWFVFCNGRMVLEADKSASSGWGVSLPQWHSKYRRFLGYAAFSSSDVTRLPWTTTKQGVVQDSPVYQAALEEMAVQAKRVLRWLSGLYPGELEPETIEGRLLLQNAKGVSLTDLPKREALFHAQSKRRARRSEVNIQYRKAVAEVEKAKELYGQPISASRLGEYTFDFFVEQKGG
jgi:Histidine kinase-, DNA gyrase B-, and HSP90-like ATPase